MPKDAHIVTSSTLLKIAGTIIMVAFMIIGALGMNILLNIQTDLKEVKTTVNDICDTQATYWLDHKCKRR